MRASRSLKVWVSVSSSHTCIPQIILFTISHCTHHQDSKNILFAYPTFLTFTNVYFLIFPLPPCSTLPLLVPLYLLFHCFVVVSTVVMTYYRLGLGGPEKSGYSQHTPYTLINRTDLGRLEKSSFPKHTQPTVTVGGDPEKSGHPKNPAMY